MKRRTVIAGAGVAALAGATGIRFWPAGAQDASSQNLSWSPNDFQTGGTSGVSAQSLPAPSFRESPNCFTTAEMTLGPCHANDVPVRLDVSEGGAGLPMRMSIRLVDAATCEPIENADIEIWQTNCEGVYSGRDVRAMCRDGSEEAASSLWFRGRQLSDENGVVSFMTVYPGWYSGRAPHVHCRILVDGRELLVTQFFYDDAFSQAVYSEHADYKGRPDADTLNSNDYIFPRTDSDEYIFDFARLEGGVLDGTITVGVEA